jgi:predicted nuclease with TOPRIM domain
MAKKSAKKPAKKSAGTSQVIKSQKNTSEPTAVKELTKSQNRLIAKQFTGILQSVVPDITKKLQTEAENFSNSLISLKETGDEASKESFEKIETTYETLKTFLDNFDVNISDLGSGFKDVQKVYETLKNQFADADDKIEKLREKNIFAESRLVVNKKNNNLEVKAIILTDQELFKKREALLEEEKN